jgi:hypothetical protein
MLATPKQPSLHRITNFHAANPSDAKAFDALATQSLCDDL